LGSAYSHLGELRKAIQYYEQALKISREIGDDRRTEGTSLNNLGFVYHQLGEVNKAVDCYEQALVILREIGDRHGEGNHLGNPGLAYSDLGEPRKATELLKESLPIGTAIEDPRIIRFCEQKLKELEGTENNKTSKSSSSFWHPISFKQSFSLKRHF
jgi:tetratricopeptide (TPR) repeat protein